MKKEIKFAAVFIIFLLVFLFSINHLFLVNLSRDAARRFLGLETRIKSIELNPFDGIITVKDLQILNPPPFKDPVLLAHVPLVVVDFNPRTIKENGVFLDKIAIHVKELNIVRNKDGIVNLSKVTALTPQEKPKVKSLFDVKRLVIEIGNVKYIDHTKEGEEKVKVIEIGLKEEYKDLKDADHISRLVAYKVFFNGKVGNIGVDILKIQNDLAKLAETNSHLAEDIKTAMSETIEKAKEKIETVKEAVEEKVEVRK
ncbi:MAG: hypothetical protein ACE5JK_01745 [Candidatus Omnitrophota bacterium]